MIHPDRIDLLVFAISLWGVVSCILILLKYTRRRDGTVKCKKCKGTGGKWSWWQKIALDCPDCEGTGAVDA